MNTYLFIYMAVTNTNYLHIYRQLGETRSNKNYHPQYNTVAMLGEERRQNYPCYDSKVGLRMQTVFTGTVKLIR